MRRELLHELVCPLTAHPLELRNGDAASIEKGELVCSSCGVAWPIENSVPRLIPPELVVQQQKTARAFGWQWQHFSTLHPEFEEQFLDWIWPITPDFFQGKRVLDAGCGTGRHTYFAARYGADAVVALDLSAAVEVAREKTRRFDNVDVVQGDILRPPFRTAADGGGFDFVYSIGVLHHLPNPYEGFVSLLRFVRPGGTVAVWLYGYENNGFVRNVIEPLRRISTRIPPPLLRGLAWPLAVGFHVAAKGIYRPLRKSRAARGLPLEEYMTSVASFSFRQNYGIVFDQLAAPTAAYITHDELVSWFERNGLVDVQISHRHGNSWRGSGRVPEGAG